MSEVDEKKPKAEPYASDDDDVVTLIGDKSPGVVRIEALSEHITFANRIFIFFGIFLIAVSFPRAFPKPSPLAVHHR